MKVKRETAIRGRGKAPTPFEPACTKGGGVEGVKSVAPAHLDALNQNVQDDARRIEEEREGGRGGRNESLHASHRLLCILILA